LAKSGQGQPDLRGSAPKQALEHQKKNGGRLGTCLVKLGLVSDDDITAVLSRQYGVPSINLKFYEVDPAVIKLIPQETAIRYQIVPLSRVGSTLTIAMTDPTNVFAMDDIKFMTGFNVEPVVASETAISEAIHKFYGEVESVEELDKVMKDLTGDEAEAGTGGRRSRRWTWRPWKRRPKKLPSSSS
jgi:type IV pilus assembly protein PilB